MKGKWIGKLLENRKMVRTGCGLMAAVVLLSGGLYMYDAQNTYMPELTVAIHDAGTTIDDEDVPLASAPKVTTKTTSKRTTKTIKLAKASAKTSLKRYPTKTTTKTSTKNSTTQTVKTVVKTQTSTALLYVKKSKKAYYITTVKTTTTTTTTQKATATKGVAKTTTATSTSTVKKTLNVNSALPKADAKLRNAFTQMGFTLKVDSTVSYSGKFDAKTRTITMRKENDDATYHEIGHFLAFLGGINTTSASGDGTKVYNAEKSKYTGSNKAYVNQSADEYFAESYRDYCTNKSALQKSRPQTYNLIVKALNNVTSAQIAKYQRVYASVWK